MCGIQSTHPRGPLTSLLTVLIEFGDIENVDLNIFTSMHNVNMDCILGYRTNGEKHSFLEKYDEE